MTTAKRVLRALLLTFVVFTAGYAVGKEVGVRRVLDRMPAPAGAVAPGNVAAGDSVEGGRTLIASYFHATKRCAKCNTIEAYAKEALETGFAEDLAAGRIEWRTANLEDVWNADAVRRYGLVRSSLVLVSLVDGAEQEHVVLHRTWDLTDAKETFLAYVASEVEMLLDDELEDDIDDDDDDDESEDGGA